MELTSLGYTLNVLAGILILWGAINAIINTSNKTKLTTEEYTLQVFIQQTCGLFLAAIGSWIIITEDMKKNGVNESFFKILIAVTAVGGIYVSCLSILLSNYVISWKA
jgi:hypothetical protein